MEFRVFSPTAILGYGFPRESLERAVRLGFDAVAVDAGSTDPGPYYLGSGEPLVPDEAVERDLSLLLAAAREHGAPLLVGSAGGAGSRVHVDRLLRVLRRAAARAGFHGRVAVVYSDVEPGVLLDGRAWRPAAPGLPPLGEAVRGAERIVAQIGVEPFLEALRLGADVVVAGRSVDPAPFAAPAIAAGADWGLALHAGKILECGALAAEPGSGADSMLGVVAGDHIEVYPVNPARRATVHSVAEHALYERRDPYREWLPGGYVDLSRVEYWETGRGVAARGARWVPVEPRMVKVEGAGPAGHRYLLVAASRDPGFISRLDPLLEEAVSHARRVLGGGFRVYARVYGRDGVMGEREPEPRPGHEVGILLEVVAGDPGLAKAAAALVRSTLMHAGWPGRRTTAGNLALPLSPSEVYAGPVYEWRVWHLVEERGPLELARIEVVEV